jgi:hypothetical protein
VNQRPFLRKSARTFFVLQLKVPVNAHYQGLRGEFLKSYLFMPPLFSVLKMKR